MSAPMRAAEELFPGIRLRVEPVEDTEEIVQLVTLDSGPTYIMKCFEADQGSLVESEVAMRRVLREFTEIECPEILEIAELDGERYVLMEHIEGERLDHRWRKHPEVVPEEMARLGTMLGVLHSIPLESAQQYLDEDLSIYAKDYFAGIAAALEPYLNADEQAALRRCFHLVNDAQVEQTVVHGDFAPIQIIVKPDGRWVLFDFEFAMIGPFADDLSGAEVRMERLGFTQIDPFLKAYEAVQPRMAAYEPVRIAFKTYLLLTVIAASINRDGETPGAVDLERLRALIRDL